MKKNIFLAVLVLAAGVLLLTSQKEKTLATFDHGECEGGDSSGFGFPSRHCPPSWDKSSLEFQDACQGSCDQIQTEICNTGDGDMAGPVDWEVWFAASGNPKFGEEVGGGEVPALESDECTHLNFDPQASGNYMFKAFQRPGHPGTGELWSEACHLDGCGQEPPRHTPTPTPTPTLPPEHTPTPTPTHPPDEVTPTPSPTPTPTPTPTSPPVGGPPSAGGGDGGAAPYSCGAVVPTVAPTLTSVSPIGSGQMTVLWTPVSPITHYSLVYGPSAGNYLYGVSNTGNVTTFTVGELDPGKNYCFAVRGVNDCAPGPLSNEVCSGGQVLGAAIGEGQVLGLSTTSGSSPFEGFLTIMGMLWILAGGKLLTASKRI